MNSEIERRRTFAIIAHPDAGKTSLTEKLLLFGGQIQVAGAVKSNKIKKTATSDWMDIEKQRGISVTSSVLQFNYAGKCVNILDTPGIRTSRRIPTAPLMAADSASWSSTPQRALRRRPSSCSRCAPCAISHLYLHQQDGPRSPRPL